MTRKDWQAVEQAARLLELDERASLAEIKRAYHRLCKRYHPDCSRGKERVNQERMYRVTAAYELLMNYCKEYRFPLKDPDPDGTDPHDPDDWWMERFGDNVFWK